MDGHTLIITAGVGFYDGKRVVRPYEKLRWSDVYIRFDELPLWAKRYITFSFGEVIHITENGLTLIVNGDIIVFDGRCVIMP